MTLVHPTGRAPVVCECTVYTGDIVPTFEVETNATGLASTACKKACEGVPGGSWTGTFRPRGIWGSKWTLDIVALCNRIRASDLQRYCQCGDDCEETFCNLINAPQSLPVPWFQTETCQKWFFSFENLGGGVRNPKNNCFKTRGAHFWTWWNMYPHGHAAIKVEACDGTMFYLNHPKWWGSNCIFAPDQIPTGWYLDVVCHPW